MRSIEASLTRKDGVKEEPGSKPPVRVNVSYWKHPYKSDRCRRFRTLTSSGKSKKDLSRQDGQCSTVRTKAKLFWSQAPVRD